MSKKYYTKINNYSIEYKGYFDKNIFKDTATITYKLLLDIIDNKTDEEFTKIYYIYINKIKFNQTYFTSLNISFNSFIDVNNFINILCSNVGNINFYRELNIYLEDIIKEIKEQKNLEDVIKEIKEQKKLKDVKELNIYLEDIIKEIKELNVYFEDIIKDIKEEKKLEEKKKIINSTIKRLVWNINIGEEIGKSKCLCCKSTDISQMSFNCGYIIAEINGGETIVSNLKPICQNCNLCIGTKNMGDFMKSLR